MAIHGTTEDKTTAPSSGAAPIDPAVSRHAPSTDFPGGTDLFGFLNRLGANQALGPDIEAYITKLRSHLPTEGAQQVVIKRLAEPQGAHVAISGKAAIILLFDALLPKDLQNYLPTSDHAVSADRSFRAEVPNIPHPLHVIVVQPEDYPLAQQMAQYLLFNLAVASDGFYSNTNIGLLTANEFVVDTSLDTARNFIGARYPHGVLPRMNLGFTLFAKTRRGSNSQFTSSLEESRPIAALGAYVEIWQPNGGPQNGPKYAATVHVTNITSDLPFPGIIPFMLAIAADKFLDRGGWKQQFSSFRKGSPNLGNLSFDPNPGKKNELWFANTPDELNTWIHANMLPRPFLAVDVVEGQARIPALAVYGDSKSYDGKVYEQITSFFGNPPINRGVPPYITLPAPTFIGTYGDPRGKLEDSREIDYLNLLAKTGSQDPSTRALLLYTDPVIRARLVAEKTGNTFKSNHRVQVSFLEPSLLSILAQEIVSKVKILGGKDDERQLSTPWVEQLQQAYIRNNFNTSNLSSHNTMVGLGTRYGI